MNPKAGAEEFLASLLKTLDRVLSGEVSWRELQRNVDHLIANDLLPTDIPNDLLKEVHNLQLDLEKIAVDVDAKANRMQSYTHERTNRALRRYQDLFRTYLT